MASNRKEIPAATQAALWALSNGRCYAPGCPSPVVIEIRPEVYRKNAQIAHIYGVSPGAARYNLLPRGEDRNAFRHLLLLCLPHHGEVDDKKTGERNYPPEILHKWKRDHEGDNGQALAMLGTLDDEQLTELLVDAFTPPIDRLQAIADQLEETGTLNANTVKELRQVIEVLSNTPSGPDAATAGALAYAADVFSAIDLAGTADSLARSADVLGTGSVERGALALSQAAEQAIAASEYYR